MVINAITGMPVLGLFANTKYGDLISGVIIFAAFLLLGFIINSAMSLYLKTIAKKTETILDDLIVSALNKPIYFAAVITGTYIALLQFDFAQARFSLMSHIYAAVMVLVVAHGVAKVVNCFIAHQMSVRRGADSDVAKHFLPLTGRIITIFIYSVALIVMLDQFNVKITALIASLGVASLAIALALQDTLANFFAGVYVMADKPVKVGDFIRLENGDEGFVEDVGWRSARIKTLSNNVIVIPNSKLAQSTLTNYNLPSKETNFSVKCCVAYGSDLEKVEKIVLAVAKDVQKTVSGAKPDFEPAVRFNEFGESNINFSIGLMVTGPVAKYLVTHELIKRLVKVFAKEGIEISRPVRNVYLKK
jgi:small-conductance mechanosensitive channel